MATWYIGTSFPWCCHHTGQAEITGLDSNGYLRTYLHSCIPRLSLAGVQVPQGVDGDQWVTVIVEVLHRQEWESVYPKVKMYRQLPGVQYIFCEKMSVQLNCWSYKLYDAENAPNPAFHNRAVRHSFDVETVDQPHVVVFDLRRVLGLPANAKLPAGKQDMIEFHIVALARDVRDD